MLNDLFQADRRLRISHKALLTMPGVREDLIVLLDNYLNDYMAYHQLTVDAVVQSYQAFLRRYLDDVKSFMTTGKYPIALGHKAFFNRLDYDLALILSVLTTFPRYRILDHIKNAANALKGDAVVIGVGSGLELELLALFSKADKILAYDLSISDFVRQRFNSIGVFEEEFVGQHEAFDYVFAVELLEHLSDPYAFVAMCHRSLRIGGRLFATTATNMPQCDHVYNFVDDGEFIDTVGAMGFRIEDKEDLQHASMDDHLKARNTWYVLQKTK